MRRAPTPRAIRDLVRVALPPTDQIPVDIEVALGAHGVAVRAGPLPPSQHARLTVHGGQAVVVLNSRRPVRSDGERRYLVAREFARHLLRRHVTGDPLAAPDRARAEADEDRAANRFAVEWLMPSRHVRRRFGAYEALIRTAQEPARRDATWRAIRELAAQFAVSPTAMRLRLEELGLIPWW